jgi:hypothetical protein
MPLDLCPTCKALRFSDDHQCLPAWSVYLDEEGYTEEEDAKAFYARFPSDAAESFAIWFFNSIGESGTDYELNVVVVSHDDEEELYYTVEGEETVIFNVMRRGESQ